MNTSTIKTYHIERCNAYNRVKQSIINSDPVHKDSNINLVLNYERMYGKNIKLWKLLSTKYD